MSVKQFIQSIREEKEGFSFDRPWRLEEKSLGVILPILRKSKKKRTYITFAEANQIKVEDTGQIEGVYVENKEDLPVYISRGELFRGKTQERAAIHGYMIMPGQGVRVAVRCIHQTKGIQGKADMEYGGRTPYSVDLSSQNKAWATVRAYSSQVSSSSSSMSSSAMSKSIMPDSVGKIECFAAAADAAFGDPSSMPAADDLVGTLDDLTGSIKEIMKKIPFIKNQVGAIFFHENSLVGMDVYDLPGSWDAVKKDVVAKEGSNFLDKNGEDMFEFKPEKAKKLAKKRLSVKFEEKKIYDKEYSVIELRSDEALGEAVIFKGQVIHLTLWKKEKQSKN